MCFALSSEADAAALQARPREDWEDAGWLNATSVTYRSPRVPPADAARLADAGISHSAMYDLRTAGHATVEQQIAATPPAVPDSPGRIILRAPDSAPRSAVEVTSDPELARHWLSTRRIYWWAGAVEHSPGARPVHVVRTGGLRDSWSRWDDGALVRGADWLRIYRPDRRDYWTAPAPTGLPGGAVHPIGLVATCSNTVCRDHAIWHPLRDAVTHAETIIEQDQRDRISWGSTKALYRHDYTLPDGSVHSLLQLHTSEGGMSSGGDGDFDERHQLWPAEAPERRLH